MIYPYDYGGDYVYIKEDYELRTEQDIIEYLSDNLKDDDLSKISELDYYSLGSFIEDNFGFKAYTVVEKYRYNNVFLTEKACEEHIRLNKHNLKNPVSYVDHAYRNREMDRLINILKNIQ